MPGLSLQADSPFVMKEEEEEGGEEEGRMSGSMEQSAYKVDEREKLADKIKRKAQPHSHQHRHSQHNFSVGGLQALDYLPPRLATDQDAALSKP